MLLKRSMSSAEPDTLFQDMGIETHGVVALTIGAPGGRQLKEAQEIVLKAAHPNNLLVKLCALWRHLAIVLNVDEPELMNIHYEKNLFYCVLFNTYKLLYTKELNFFQDIFSGIGSSGQNGFFYFHPKLK